MDVFTKGQEGKELTGQLVFMQFVGATPLAIISFFIIDYSTFFITFSYELLFSLAFNAFLASLLVTFIHTRVQRYTTPVKAALIFSLEPIIASSVAMLFLAEILSSRELFGAAILMLGVVASELGGFIYRPKSERANPLHSE